MFALFITQQNTLDNIKEQYGLVYCGLPFFKVIR